MDNRYSLLGLHELEGVGWKTIQHLLSKFPEPSVLIGLSASEIASCGIRASVAELVSARLTPSFIEQKLHLYRSQGIQILTRFDDGYPERLKEIAQPPWVLYVKGDSRYLNHHLLGIVGTRTPTLYGKKIAEEWASALSRTGFGIVSGLARGIDSKAHIGALQGKSKTVAVLGCAINSIYPRENALLFRQIEQEGAIISEYPIGTGMRPGMFPQRNRIIAGLSLGVTVVEAAEDSGSLITVEFALDASRDVFAVPGPINSRQSSGVHKLLKDGAKLVTRVEEIVEEYQHLFGGDGIHVVLKPEPAFHLTKDEVEIVRKLSDTPVSIDTILEDSQFTFGHLHAVLLSLVLKKAIKQLPGSTYIRA
ncbi:DNA protecting protein DprA [Paenibacillus pectinilyticus]|uniref:DNA protecting protein DprA n=1 Tax=Paenibacillus pectinilyticus TaxID=512399 RepID=A0A1C1A0B6_9BACL|nr:DNA-processing protein DprA [Paenibacillus pectinilyticus]OCT13828.1 DNA protecting protein DprA [Paenibacillus pectinilyticus]